MTITLINYVSHDPRCKDKCIEHSTYKGPRRRKREKVSPNQGPTLKYVLKYNCQMYTLNNVP